MNATVPSAQSAREQALEARLVELETRLSFQEHTIAELSDALAEARMEGARNTNLLRVLMEDLGKMRNAHVTDFSGFDIEFDNYGSTNSAETRNDENLIVLYDPFIAAQFVAEFQRVFALAEK